MIRPVLYLLFCTRTKTTVARAMTLADASRACQAAIRVGFRTLVMLPDHDA